MQRLWTRGWEGRGGCWEFTGLSGLWMMVDGGKKKRKKNQILPRCYASRKTIFWRRRPSHARLNMESHKETWLWGAQSVTKAPITPAISAEEIVINQVVGLFLRRLQKHFEVLNNSVFQAGSQSRRWLSVKYEQFSIQCFSRFGWRELCQPRFLLCIMDILVSRVGKGLKPICGSLV